MTCEIHVSPHDYDYKNGTDGARYLVFLGRDTPHLFFAATVDDIDQDEPLEQFVLQPESDAHPFGSSCFSRFVGEWVQLFSGAAQRTNLREVALRAVPVDAASFAKVCAAAPNVVQLNMRDSRWRADSAAAAAALDGMIVRAIGPLAHLRWVHLGEVPGGEAVLERTHAWCERAGVTLVWQSVPLPREEADAGASASASPAS